MLMSAQNRAEIHLHLRADDLNERFCALRMNIFAFCVSKNYFNSFFFDVRLFSTTC
jgi:hypothetical protein